MGLFVHEYFSSGACPGELRRSSLAPEGLAMLGAVLQDFAACFASRPVTTLDVRLRAEAARRGFADWADLHWAESPRHEFSLFEDLPARRSERLSSPPSRTEFCSAPQARRAGRRTLPRPCGRGNRGLFGQAGLLRASHAARFADDCHARIRSVCHGGTVSLSDRRQAATTEPVRKRRI